MTTYALITAVGADRPGLVDELSEALAEREMNIEASRMALLGGEFAMILLVSGAAAAVEALASSPGDLAAASGLEVIVKPTSAPDRRRAPDAVPFRIVTSGMDHRGIVHDIAAVLHRFAVSIAEMDTRVAPAPVSGTPVFNMEATVAVPVEVKIRALREELEQLGDELNMDIELTPAEQR